MPAARPSAPGEARAPESAVRAGDQGAVTPPSPPRGDVAPAPVSDQTAAMSETLIVIGVRPLGGAFALHFAKQGWQVVCAARTAETVQAVAAEVDQAGGRGIPVVCDLGDPASLAALVRDRG